MIRRWWMLLALALPVVSQAADRYSCSAAAGSPAVVQVACKAVRAYLDGDVAALRAAFAGEGEGDLRDAEIEAMSRARVRCVGAAHIIIDVVSPATVHASAGWWQQPRFRTLNLRLEMASSGSAWKVAKWERREALLAAQIAAAPNEADALLRDNTELITLDLVTQLRSVMTESLVKGNRPRALELLAIAKRAAALGVDPFWEAGALESEASLKGQIGDAAGQMEAAKRAVAAAEQSGEPEALASAYGELGRAYERLPDGSERAAELYEKAIALDAKVESRVAISRVFGSYATLRVRLNDHDKAIPLFERVIEISRPIDDFRGEQAAELGMAVVFTNQSDTELAMLHAKRVVELAPRAAAPGQLAQGLMLLADALLKLGRNEEAKATVGTALAEARRIGETMALGNSLRVSGRVSLREHDAAAAAKTFEEAYAVLIKGNRPRAASDALADLAQAYFETGNAAAALAKAEECAAIAQKSNYDSAYVICRTAAGLAQRALGNSDAALASFQDATAVIETMRVRLAGDARERTRYFASAVTPYEAAVDLLAEKERIDEAFAMAERARGRALLDVLQSGKAPRDIASAAAEKDAALSGAIVRLNRRIREERAKAAPDAAAIAKLSGELEQARTEYAAFQAELYTAQPRLRRSECVVDIASPASLASLVSPSSALVEYVVEPNRTLAFVITQSNGAPKLQMIAIPVARAELTKRAGEFAVQLARRDAAYRAASRALYDLLLAPAERALRGVTTLGVIPDGALWGIPFEALTSPDGKFVVESRAIYYVPSASVLAEITHVRISAAPALALLAVGNPEFAGATREKLRAMWRDATLGALPEAEDEVRQLRQMYGSRQTLVYTGAAATEEAVKAEIANARVVHFATHATFDDHNPMYSQVVLAQEKEAREDGLLEAWEILRMSLRADLVVLSACETARGEIAAGEGMIGFTWALFVAGCPSSVVSHWKVSSAATAKLMVAFHRRLLAAKNDPFQKAAALRRAKLDLLATGKWRHPFYWSAPVLFGSPRLAD